MNYKQRAKEVQCVLEIQQPNFFVPTNLLLLVRRVFPHLAGAADIGSWVVLASVPGAWSRSGLGGRTGTSFWYSSPPQPLILR